MEREPDLVSVIIPCYNHGPYIHEAIQSILDQSCQDFEIIVVDDGSDDPATIEVLRNIQAPKTTVYHKENGHLSSARNFGIRKSRGEFILPLDADDKFAPTFIERARRILRTDPATGVVTCHLKSFGSDLPRTYKPKGGSLPDFLAHNNSCGNALFRYECWADTGGYKEDLRGYEDWEFWIHVTSKGWLVQSIPEVLFFYRDTPGSMIKAADENRPELVRRIVSHHLEIYHQNLLDVIYRKELTIRSLNTKISDLKRARGNRAFPVSGTIARAPLKWIRRLAGRKPSSSPSSTQPS